MSPPLKPRSRYVRLLQGSTHGPQGYNMVNYALGLTWNTDFFTVKGEPLLMMLHNCVAEYLVN